AEAGQTVDLEPLVRGLDELSPRAAPEAMRGWPIAHAYVVYYVLVYRRAAVREAPVSWSELETPAHRRRVAVYPKGNGLFPVLQLLGGGLVDAIPETMDPAWRALERLRDQISFIDYSPTLAGPLQSGDVSLAFRTLPNALGFREDGLDIDWVA